MEKPKKIIKVYHSKIIDIDEKKHLVKARTSTIAPDRYNEIVIPKMFAETIQNYISHGVLLSSHDYFTDLRKNIGMSLEINLTEEAIENLFEYFVGKGNAEADWGFFLAQKGIAAYSIGFMEREWIDGDGKEFSRKYTKGELLEISQVLVPAHPQALQSALMGDDIRREMAETVLKTFGACDYQPLNETETKAGKVISAANRAKIQAAADALNELLIATEDTEENKQAEADRQQAEEIQTEIKNLNASVDDMLAKLKEGK